MADFNGNDNYGLKILLGTIIGIIVILFLVPLGANIIASEEVASASNDAFNTVDSSYGRSPLSIPIDTVNVEAIMAFQFVDNSTNVAKINNTLVIVDNSSGNVSNTTNGNNNNTTGNNSDLIINNSPSNNNDIPEIVNDTPTDEPQDNNKNTDLSNMRILSGTISTGSGLNDKSVCTVYVGSEYAGENIQISTLYSRDGSNLNAGRLVSKTVDSSGYVTLRAAESYELYPSECLITIYDSSGSELDYKNVNLAPESGTQSF